jgi:hypothetical protein
VEQAVGESDKAMSRIVAGYAQTLLRHVLEHPAELTDEQLLDAGRAARQILAFAWGETERSSWLVTTALRAVCQTFITSPEESGSLLRRSLEPAHLANFGYEEMPVITREVSNIADSSPELVAEIYRGVFAHEEMSDDSTNMSGSQILALTSNRKQDYDHSKWQLGQYYPVFVKDHPLLAAEAMIKVIDEYRIRERSTENPPEKFKINGVDAAFIQDYSFIWDESSAAHHDAEVGILDAFFREFEGIIQNPVHSASVDEILSFLMGGSRPGIIWRRLLQLGARFPRELGLKLLPLASIGPLMWIPDTEVPATDFIVALFPLLNAGQREQIEMTIVSLPETVPPNLSDAVKRNRDLLLSSLGNSLGTDQARQMLKQQEETKVVPAPHHRGPRFQVTTRSIDEKMYLEEILGVKTESEPNKTVLEVNRPVLEFNVRHMNKAVGVEEIEAVSPKIQALHGSLSDPPEGVDQKLLTKATGDLAQACKIIANNEAFSCDSSQNQQVRSILLELSEHSSPEYDAANDAAFNDHPSWGAPLARIESAQGLIALSRHASCCSPNVLEAIERLAADSVPAVRYQIAANLTLLYKTARSTMWKLFESRTNSETNNGVLGALAHSVSNLMGAHPDEAAKLVQSLLNRTKSGPGADDVQSTCVQIFVQLYLWRNHRASEKFVYTMCNDVHGNHKLLNGMIFMLRGALTLGDTKNLKADEEETRTRAIKLFRAITEAACKAFSAATEEANSGKPEIDREVLQGLARLVDQSAQQLYFASGTFHDPQVQEPLSNAQRKRFYEEHADTIDLLSKFGFARTVHHLIEMLQTFIPFNPRRVFLQVATLVEIGKNGSYQYESMAVPHIVAIVERYIAEYSSLLQEDESCRIALRKTLDIFVEAGWPAAQKLSYKLDEIFR